MTDGDENLTQAQSEAIVTILALCREHFDTALFAFETEEKDGTSKIFNVMYNGGLTTCLGLSDRSRHQLLISGELYKDHE